MKQDILRILLKDLLALPQECEWVEFKVNNSKPDDIGQYLSALSNGASYNEQQRGFLVFGIEDRTHRVVVTTFKPFEEKIGGQELQNWLATQLEPRVDFAFFEFEMEGNNVVIVKVDATHTRPVAFRGIEYIRIGSYKKLLKEHPEREKNIWENAHKITFEKEIAKENVNAKDIFDLIHYETLFALQGFPLPSSNIEIVNKLLSEKVIVKGDANNYHITNMGALLLARELSDFENVERKGIRLIKYKKDDRISSEKEITGGRGYAVGFIRLMDLIKEHIPSNEIIENSLRKTIYTYPELAIRELVANALIHQD